MRGFPKYKIGDVVRFRFRDEEKTGIVAIIDAFGTFEDPSDVSYDIMSKDENALYKHLIEPRVIEKIGEVDPGVIWKQ